MRTEVTTTWRGGAWTTRLTTMTSLDLADLLALRRIEARQSINVRKYGNGGNWIVYDHNWEGSGASITEALAAYDRAVKK